MVRQAVLVDALLAAALSTLAVDTAARSGASDWPAYLIAVLSVVPIAPRDPRGFAVTMRLPISQDGS